VSAVWVQRRREDEPVVDDEAEGERSESGQRRSQRFSHSP
jgi:hypothetical protein